MWPNASAACFRVVGPASFSCPVSCTAIALKCRAKVPAAATCTCRSESPNNATSFSATRHAAVSPKRPKDPAAEMRTRGSESCNAWARRSWIGGRTCVSHPMAEAAWARTSGSSSSRLLAKCGAASAAACPILPRARAACFRTAADSSLRERVRAMTAGQFGSFAPTSLSWKVSSEAAGSENQAGRATATPPSPVPVIGANVPPCAFRSP
mmetsp:Transcript_109710/g.261531  ORF Transcript_109710/g.261531 Transcript_109710/m.261531 type:complete len:210 (-) Transcript_109710:8-637(-)